MTLNKSSLFWKIFLSFWIANILVLSSATYFTLQNTKDRENKNHRKEITSHIGDLFIPYLQSGDNKVFTQRRWKKQLKRNFRIVNVQGDILLNSFNYRFVNEKNKTKSVAKKNIHLPIFERYPYTSENGQQYFIELPVNRAKLMLRDSLHTLLVFRLLLILFFSSLVSYFLTRFITQPLNTLGACSRAFSDQNFYYQKNEKLLQRHDEIGSLARDINTMQENLTTLINDKQKLLHDVSHELRAPLARIVAASALLDVKYPNEITLLQRLNNECDNMSALIESILHLSRISEQPPHQEIFNLTTLLKQCKKDCQFEFPDIEIDIHCPENIRALTDTSLLSTALMNLLRNSCIHSGSKSPIRLQAYSEKNNLIIIIEDEGKGLTAEQLNKLFTPFQKNGSSAGFGLGMSISKKSIEQLSGSLKAENKLSGGLTLSIKLPAVVVL